MTDRRDDVRARFAAAEDVDLPEGVTAEAQAQGDAGGVGQQTGGQGDTAEPPEARGALRGRHPAARRDQ